MNEETFNKKIAVGAVWMTALRGSIKFIGIISTMILARLLAPEDFGIVALGTSIYAMVELMREFGFDTVLIQKQKADRRYYDTAWTIQVCMSLCASFVIFILAAPLSDFYIEPRLEGVLYAMSVIIFINGFKNVGVIDFRKQLNFNKDFLFEISVKLSGFFVTIPLAFYWRSYWALLAGMVVTQFVSWVLSYKMQRFRPRFSLKVWREILSFSVWLFINNILFFLSSHGQNLVIGKLLGKSPLGLFSVSNEIGSITNTDIIASINRAAYPGFAKVADDLKKLRALYLKVLSYVIIIGMPSALGIAAISPLFVPILLGEKWIETIPIIEVIAFASFFSSISTCSSYIYLALARQKITTLIVVLRLVILLPCLLILLPKYEILGAAYAILISAVIIFPISQIIINTILKVSFRSLVALLWRPTIASIFMYGAVSHYCQLMEGRALELENIGVLLGAIGIGGWIYASTLLTLWLVVGQPDTAEKGLLDAVAKLRKRF